MSYMNEEYKYVIGHEVTIPTGSYANEKFYYSAKGNTKKEVVEDLKELQELYPAEVAKTDAGTEKNTPGF